MTHEDLFAPLDFTHGPSWKNRLALAPLTNQQSHADGRLSDEEFRWLTMRAEGGFGLTMTCAAHVQACGQGFPGQLGIFDDRHLEGLSRLAAAIKANGSVSSAQLHHAGIRAEKSIIAQPVGPSDHAQSGSRGLTTAQVEALRDDFIAAAKRAEAAGFDGVEVHGAHGYILAAFLSPQINLRDDQYGGSIENRTRLIFEILDGIRAACRPDFQLGLRISPERFGMPLLENVEFVSEVMRTDRVDYLDLSLWDYRKLPDDETLQERTLLGHFSDLPRHSVKLGGAGKIRNAADVHAALGAGLDFVLIGRAAILRHDFPERTKADPDYRSPELPVTVAHLGSEGVSPAFVNYLRGWKGFVVDDVSAAEGGA